MAADEHVLHIGQSFTSDDWTASCSCGWSGHGEHESRDGAVDEWENHTDAVFMEATGG